jgi:SAM-dependent methyltransferase
LNWEDAYTVSRALVFQVGDRGELLARRSLSRAPQAVDSRRLPVLLAFAAGATPLKALARLREEAPVEEAAFCEAVAELIEQELLTPAEGGLERAFRSPSGFSSAAIHYPLVADGVRVLAYREAIFRHCRDRTVVEIGCGSGILSIFAAQAGARRVVAIEEGEIADLAAEMFRANGVADVVELHRANSRDVSLAERADVIVHEVLGVDPFDEALLPTIADAGERLLAPGGRLLPFALEVFCVGFEVEDRPYLDGDRAAANLRGLGERYGVDFDPFQRALALDPAYRQRPLGHLGQTKFEPRILTDELRLWKIDLRPGAPSAVEPGATVRLRIREAGSLGGLLLYFRAQLDEQAVLSTAPDRPRTSWKWDARPLERLTAVEPGDEVPLKVELRTVRGLEVVDIALV